MNSTSSTTVVLTVFLTAASCFQLTSYGQQKSESSRKSPASSVSDIIDWDRVYEEALESNADIRRKVEQGEATKAEVIEWLKLDKGKAGKVDRGGSRHNFPGTASEYAKLIEPQLGVPPRVDLSKAVEIPLFANGKRAYGNLGTACDNRTYLGKATVSGSTLQRYPGRTADGKLLPDVIWISFGRNSTEEFEEVVGSVQMIGYNRKTGATAFFESNGSNLRPWVSLDKETWRMRGVMPWIDDPDEFNRAFVTPENVQCVECHQADPFITNDFINAAKIPGTDESVVPALDKDSPYFVIGGENWDMRTIHIEGNACFDCHRVGMSTMNLFMENDWDPNQHMPPHDPGSLNEDFEELLTAWINGVENTPGAEWVIPPKGAPGENKVVKEDYPHKSDFNESEGNGEFDGFDDDDDDNDNDWQEEDDEDQDEGDARERDQRRTGRTALMYARECEQQLGPLPKFCFEDAVEIPTYQDGKRVIVTEENLWKILRKGDIPASFGAPYQLGNRVGRYQGKKKDGSPNPDVVFVTFYRDGGLGVIGHNMKTGATCFLSVEDGTDVREELPTPDMPGYEKAWQPPSVVAKDGCVNCHMADPFLHTPWIDQVRVKDDPDETLVPLIADATSPYFVIGDEFPAPPGRKPGNPYATIPKHLEGNKCVQCHAPQCVPDFFNVKLDELKMSAPFHNLEKETRERWIKDRDAVRAYCRSLEIQYFESEDENDSIFQQLLQLFDSENDEDE